MTANTDVSLDQAKQTGQKQANHERITYVVVNFNGGDARVVKKSGVASLERQTGTTATVLAICSPE